MRDVFAIAAIWAFLGGVGYAGARLSTALWGGREISERARRHAVAQFVLAIVLAPAAGEAFTPIVLASFPRTTLPSTAFLIGLTFNAVWPLLVEPQFLRSLIADAARGIAARLTPGEPR